MGFIPCLGNAYGIKHDRAAIAACSANLRSAAGIFRIGRFLNNQRKLMRAPRFFRGTTAAAAALPVTVFIIRIILLPVMSERALKRAGLVGFPALIV